MNRVAQRIVTIFDAASLDKTSIDDVAWWVKYLSTTPVMAKIIYFCDRILND